MIKFENAEYKKELTEIVNKSSMHFLEAESLYDLFESVLPDTAELWEYELPGGINTKITGNCNAMRTGLKTCLRVVPNAAVIKYIENNMLVIDYDKITFKLVEREDGLLVIAKNSQIIGSRWLALVNPKTLKVK